MQTYIELGETGRKRTHLSLFSLCSPPPKKISKLSKYEVVWVTISVTTYSDLEAFKKKKKKHSDQVFISDNCLANTCFYSVSPKVKVNSRGKKNDIMSRTERDLKDHLVPTNSIIKKGIFSFFKIREIFTWTKRSWRAIKFLRVWVNPLVSMAAKWLCWKDVKDSLCLPLPTLW